jgi:hypothetical protein
MMILCIDITWYFSNFQGPCFHVTAKYVQLGPTCAINPPLLSTQGLSEAAQQLSECIVWDAEWGGLNWKSSGLKKSTYNVLFHLVVFFFFFFFKYKDEMKIAIIERWIFFSSFFFSKDRPKLFYMFVCLVHSPSPASRGAIIYSGFPGPSFYDVWLGYIQ